MLLDPAFEVRRQPDRPRFEYIRGVIRDSLGRIVVLDQRSATLTWLDLSGRVVAQSSQDGFRVRRPASLMASGRQVQVLDGQGGEILSVAQRNSGVKTEGRIRLPLSMISGMCRVDGKTVVMGRELVAATDTSRLLHVVTPSGVLSKSFGAPFGTLPPFGQIALGVGFIQCAPESRTIIMASRMFPEVRAYSSDGVLRWKAPIPEFHPIRVEMPSDRSVRYAYPPDSIVDDLVQMIVVSPNLVALQIGRGAGEQRRESPQYVLKTTFYSVASGKRLWEQKDIPEIVGASGDTLFFVKGADRGRLYLARRRFEGQAFNR